MGGSNNDVLVKSKLVRSFVMGLFASYCCAVFTNLVVASTLTTSASLEPRAEQLQGGHTLRGSLVKAGRGNGGLRLNLRRRKSDQGQPDHHFEGGESKLQLNAYFKGAFYRGRQRLRHLQTILDSTPSTDFDSGVLTSKDGSSATANTYSIGGEYVTDFQLGSPAQSVKLILDTGSDLVWVIAGFYDNSNSSTYQQTACSDTACTALPSSQCQDNSCTYFYQYGDGSAASGVLSQESVVLSLSDGQAQSVDDFKFGYSTSLSGSFAGSGGLLGLGLGQLSFASQVGNQFGNQFSYCLVDWNAPSTSTSPLFFGETATDSSTADSEITYTPFISNSKLPSFYYLGLDTISVGGTDVSIPSGTFDVQSSGYGGMLIDSGTTLTYLVADAYAPFMQAFQSQVSYPTVAVNGIDLCYDVSGAETPAFPSLVFTFTGGGKLVLPQANYMVQATSSASILCFAFAQSTQFSILGNIQQQNYRVVYDRGNSRLGWTGPLDCGSS